MDGFNKVKYNNDFNKKAYDQFTLMLPKGYKDKLKKYASANNLSVNSVIKMAIDKFVNL